MRGGLTRRMVVASGLLALIIAAAFAVLLSSVSELRTLERRARESEEVLVVANRLERLVVDLETGQRGFVITGQDRFLQPWREAQVALPAQASNLEQLVADNPGAAGSGAADRSGHHVICPGLLDPAGQACEEGSERGTQCGCDGRGRAAD